MDEYAGREYGNDEDLRKVMIMEIQQTLHPWWKGDCLAEMIRYDPGMPDLPVACILPGSQV